MSLQYSLISGAAQLDGLIWKNRSTATGAPTSPTAGPQTSIVTVGGTPHAAAAAVAQAEVVTYIGTPSAGQVLKLGLKGTVYSFPFVSGTLDDALDGLVAAAAADPNWTTVRVDDTIVATRVAAGVAEPNEVASVNLVLAVQEAFTGTPAAGDKAILNLEASQYIHTVTAGETTTQIATALATLAANDPYWAATHSTGNLIARNKYPNQTVDAVSCSVTRAKDVYGNDIGSLVVTKTTVTGDLQSVIIISVPGTDAVSASVFAVHCPQMGATYSTTYTTGQSLNDVAVALAVQIAGDFTAPAPAGTDILVTGSDGVAFDFFDASNGGANTSSVIQTPASTTEAASPTDAKYWRCTQSTLLTFTFALVSGTSFKYRIDQYNAALGVWLPGTLSAAVTASEQVQVDCTGADGIYVALSDFAGSGVASVQATGNGQS